MPIEPDPDGAGSLTSKLGDTTITASNATVTPLAEADARALLARLEPLPAVDNSHAPAMRPASAPPPRAGSIEPIAFVRPTGKQVGDAPIASGPMSLAPLTPPQILPAGEIQAESEIRVRFEEPMVAVAAVGKDVPSFVTITPPIAGSWRWVDTRVAQFTVKAPRFPAATQFTVHVAPGVKSVSGAKLAVEQTGTFSTPPVMLTGIYPSVTVRPDSPLLLEFDQDIDPDAIVKFVHVEDEKKHALAFKTITLDEAKPLWAKNTLVAQDKRDLSAHRVIIAPATAWPASTLAFVTLGAKAPSREGPRLSARETAERFNVAAPFVVKGLSCASSKIRVSGATCPAWSPLEITMSNPIDRATYHARQIQIEGAEIEDHKPNDEQVWLTTPHDVGGRHAVVIEDPITDVYGQPLGGPKRLTFSVSREHFDAYVYANEGLYVLDPRFQTPQWVVEAQAMDQLHVQLYQVQPADYFAYQDYEAGKRATPPGKRVYDKQYPVGARYFATARVDLRPALGTSGTGHVIAVAQDDRAPKKATERRRIAWIEVTRLGVTARVDGDKVNAWAVDITPATFRNPIAGAETSLVVEGRNDAPPAAKTDAEGHVAYDLLPNTDALPHHDANRTALLVLKSGDDSVLTAVNTFEKSFREQQARWYVTDDRFTYKPGETVYLKGWVRWTNNGPNPDISLPPVNDKVAYTLVDARGNRIASGEAKFTPQGGFDAQVAIPANADLGTARFNLTTQNQSFSHPIAIQEFRTPAYAVTMVDDVTHAGATPLVLGESIDMSAEAKYYGGGGLPAARIEWNASIEPVPYRPPGWDRYSFDTPFKRSESRYYREYGPATNNETLTRLSGASTSAITYAIASLPHHMPGVLSVDATVTDIDRQTIRASSRKILVHPATRYVGMRLDPDSLDDLRLVVTDIDGNLVAGVSIDVTIEGVLASERRRDDAEVVDTQHCKLTSGTEPVSCAFKRKNDQTAYTAIARIADPRGRANAAQYDIPWWAWPDADLQITADRPKYKPGDVAKLEVRSQVLPATAIVTIARQGVITQKRLELTKPTTSFELPIELSYIENVEVMVDRVAKRKDQLPGSDLPLPEIASAEINLPVDVESARLTMRTWPTQPLVEPGANATFEVEVKHDDKPLAGAEVALVAVDEAILALSGKSHEDPLASFYDEVQDGTTWLETFELVRDSAEEGLDKPPGFDRFNLDTGVRGHGFGTGAGYGYGGGRGGMRGIEASTSVVTSRKDFRPTAVFAPVLITDDHGRAKVTVKMPDSLTRFRIVALATARTHFFGKAESSIVTQRKVNARTVAPRFLTQGDAFSLPVVVQNLDQVARTIDVGARALNLESVGPMAKRVLVPAGERAEVRFDFTTQARGKVVIQTIAASGDFADASNVELPVYEPATTESFATYGNLDDKPQFERLEVPSDVFVDVGGVEAEMSSTQMQELTDAYWYLYAYPFECAEQRSARMLATTAMYDVLDAFATPGRPTRDEIAKTRAADVAKLTRDQNTDGGWGYYRTMETDRFVTIQVLQALAAQKEQGAATKKAIAYVTALANGKLTELEATARAHGQAIVHRDEDAYPVALAAAALSALATANVDVAARAVRLDAVARQLRNYPVDAKAQVLAILAGQSKYKAVREKALADLLSAVHETASAANVATGYTDAERLLLVSSTKSTALVLDAILRESPQHALVPKLARGLLDARRRGRWRSTQENLVVLRAMRRYFDLYEKDTPNYTGKLWVGSAAYAEQAFVGRSNARAIADLDWTQLAPGTTHDVALQKTGPGRMYYRLGITYAPKEKKLPALDAGFIVRRTYKAIDDPADVALQADGTWQVKLGARVQVIVEEINTSPRSGVALVDPLPAGFEAVNDRLATSERAAIDSDADHWEFVNMRDNRSEAFIMSLREGTHRFSYTARATTPGTFFAAPAKAEEMYAPETFGRSAGTQVFIH